nr:reverse transcriptase domain-containing protein [Tanacetum cinerariifolium]
MFLNKRTSITRMVGTFSGVGLMAISLCVLRSRHLESCFALGEMGIRRVVPRNYNPKGERFFIAPRFPTLPLACAFFSLRATVTSSSKLARDQTSNPTSSTNPIPKGRIRRSSKQKVENSHFEEHLTPIAIMTDNRIMAEMLYAPIEGCAEAILVPSILTEQFELKHSLINMMTLEQFFGLEKDNPHDHIRWFNKITSTIKYNDVANSVIKLILFPFSLTGAAHQWLEKEPSRSITTWDDLVLKFINELFPPSRTTNLRNEILNFQQKFDESFHVAWERYKDLLRACPHYRFTKLHQLDTFYNALNPADQDSLNAAAGGNFSEIAKLTHAVNQQTSVVTTAMTAMLKQLQSNPPPAQVKAVEEICVTYGGAHPYYQCLATGGNTFPEFKDNIQGYVSAAAGNYNQGNPGYRPQAQSNQNFHLNELEKIKRMNDVSLKAMQNQIDMVKNELRNEMKTSIQTSLSNQTNEIKNMMASLLQMNTASTSGSRSLPGNTIANSKGELEAITTRSGLVTDGPTVPTPPKSVNPEEDECVEETYTNPNLAEYTIKVPPPPVTRKLGDLGKFLIPCGFSELKCKALVDLGASINLMPLSVWKKLGLPDLIPTRMTLELANRAICTPDGIARDVFVPVGLELANRAICTPDGIARDVFVPVGKFTFPADFVIVDYESDPRVPFILGRPFLRTARALIDVHGEEMILRDGDERLTLNMKHDTASYSNHPHRESVNLINIFNLLSEDCLEDLVSKRQSGNPTFLLHKEIASSEVTHEIHDSKGLLLTSANSLFEEFADELALITYPLDYDDNRTCDIEFDLREIEFLLYQGEDSDFKDSIDQFDLTNRDDLFVGPTPEMFTDEQPPDYSFPPRFDVYPNDFLEIESNADNCDNDSFDSEGEKIKEAKLLIDQLDLPCDILSEYDSFNSQDFSTDDDLPSPNNEDKAFNPGIIIHGKSVTIITRVAQEKKLAVSYASLLFEDLDPPFYELFFQRGP